MRATNEEVSQMTWRQLYKHTGGYTEPTKQLLEGIKDLLVQIITASFGCLTVALMIIALPITPFIRCVLARSQAARRFKSFLRQQEIMLRQKQRAMEEE